MKQYKNLVNEERLNEFKSFMKRYIAKVMSQQGGGTIRPATIVVAASNSRNKTGADYVCTGTNDQNTINDAINALPSGGGKVLLLEGTYNLGGRVSTNKSNITLAGIGAATILKRCFTGTNWYEGIVDFSGDYCIIRDLMIDGAKSTYSTDEISAVRNTGWCGSIENIIAVNNHSGIIINVPERNTTIRNNTIVGCTSSGICLYGTTGVHATGNFVSQCAIGIYLDSYSRHHLIEDNYIRACSESTITIATSSCTNNHIVDNFLCGHDYINNGGTSNTFVNNKYIE